MHHDRHLAGLRVPGALLHSLVQISCPETLYPFDFDVYTRDPHNVRLDLAGLVLQPPPGLVPVPSEDGSQLALTFGSLSFAVHTITFPYRCRHSMSVLP